MEFVQEDVALEFHDKIVRNDFEACELLLRDGFKPDEPMRFTTRSVTCINRELVSRELIALPLHVSCIYRRPEIVLLLLRHGADPNGVDKLGRCPLQLTLSYWPRLMYFDPIPSSFTKEEIEYQTYLKVQHGKSKTILEALCTSGANVNAAFNHRGSTALHHSVQYNVLPAIPILLQYGVNLEASDDNGMTPVLTAAKLGRFRAMETLVHLGADINAKDSRGNTLVHYTTSADSSSQSEWVEFLLAQPDCKVNVQNVDGNTPLHFSCMSGRESAIFMLINAGATIEATNNQGQTPLFLCLLKDVTSCSNAIEKLLNESRQVNIIDHNGNIPGPLTLDVNKKLKEILVDASTFPNSLQNLCRWAVRQSVRNNHRELAEAYNNLNLPVAIENFVLFNTKLFERL
ncbi:unnamed protein product [Owenia fusiformis]|uniref:SOCS box domain-containing protein n=1 Tax=Owenia fusiformis TaxID=6347 RepID=A0A8S4NTN7_OWEFU|nr:unnamed protein product [Owenia fusiformis]